MNYNLQQRLDAFVSGEYGTGSFLQELVVLCDETPDAAWDILSLVDQYYRRGRLPVDLFRTLKGRIERHALGIDDSDITVEFSEVRTIVDVPTGTARGEALAVPAPAAAAEEPAREVRASHADPRHARRMTRRCRERSALLSEFVHHTRSAVAYTRWESGLSHSRAAHHPGRRRRIERRKCVESRKARPENVTHGSPSVAVGSTNVAVTRGGSRVRWSVLAALLLSAGASPMLRDLPASGGAGQVTLPITTSTTTTAAAAGPVAAVVPPQLVDPGQITLSSDRVIVFPGHTSAEIQVQRVGGVTGDVSFVWWTEGSGARPGRDYVSGKRMEAHLPDGVDTLHLSVPILPNRSRKHTELFYVVIGKPGGGASLGSTRRATVFIMRPGQ
jgi:hypothetical protein